MSLLLVLVQLLITTAVNCQLTRVESGQSTTAGCYESKSELRQVKQRLDSLENMIMSLHQMVQGQVKTTASIHRSINGQVSFPSLTHIISGDAYVAGLASFNSQLFVTRYGVNQIAVYNTSTFQFVRDIPVPGSVDWLAGLAPCPTKNCLYVSDYKNNRVHKVPFDEPAVTSWSVVARPIGLHVNRQRNILVAVDASKRIQEYTPSGTLVREITDNNYLYHTVELTDGNLVVSRFGPMHDVCRLSAINGTVLRCYGSAEGSGPGQLKTPHSLAVDKKGFIFVADLGNNRIVVLNPTLTEGRTLSLPTQSFGQLNQPRAIWLDESIGRLYVGENASPYRVLVFDNVFNIDAVFTP